MVKVKVFDSSAAKASKRQLMEAPATDAGAFYDVVDSRRSVRIYADEPVPEEAVRRAMDAALKAPQFLQPSGVGNPLGALRRKEGGTGQILLGPTCGNNGAGVVGVRCASRLMAPQQQPDDCPPAFNPKTPEKAFQYFEKITKIVYNQGPFGVFRPFKWIWFTVRGWSKPTPREPISLAHMDVWAHKTTALACQTFMLAARAEGARFMPHGRAGFQTRQTIARLAAPRWHHHGHLDGETRGRRHLQRTVSVSSGGLHS